MDSAIEIAGLQRAFGDRVALAGVDLQVRRGDIFGYLGANGAGKTTTIRILLDLLRPDAGEARILGEDCAAPDTRRNVGFVLDADGLYNAMTAVENLVFYAALYGVALDAALTARLLDLVGLTGRGDEPVAGFSRGMRQRLALSRALAHDPEVLILDEPMTGVDPPGRLVIREILQRLVSEEGKTVLLSSHNLDEVQRMCNRIALIDEGRIRLHGDLRSLMKQSEGNKVQVDLESYASDEAVRLLRARPDLREVELDGRVLTCIPGANLKIPQIVTIMAEAGLEIAGVRPREASLEELYRSILREREGTE